MSKRKNLRPPADDTEALSDEYLLSGEATKQKRQEYNRNMSRVAGIVRDRDPVEVARYLSNLAEDERRFVNRRRARSVALGSARETLFVRQFEELAGRLFRGKIVAGGYAAKRRSAPPAKRIANLLLSDLHVGANLAPEESPEAFGFVEARRRLAKITIDAGEFKSQYRDHTHLNLYLGGDVIEGNLGHDQADGAPLAEQCAAFVRMMVDVVAHLAAAFPSVSVYCQSGNHGRNKLRHEGRATNQKWDSFESVLYQGIRAATAHLPTVEWHIPKAPVCVVPLFDRHLLLTHGDTELKIGPPSTKANTVEVAINKLNANLTYGKHIDLLAFGHFHDPTVKYFARSAFVANGALVPANGHARTSGYGDTPCGQYLWESVPGFALGDVRYLRVGQAEDGDASLDRVVKPFTW